ncbi:hypothetical protein SISNIDRAFT_414094, partial [Sistotremastrum niveocremeum HHB9708]
MESSRPLALIGSVLPVDDLSIDDKTLIDTIAREHTLNKKQSLAFRLVCMHSVSSHNTKPPLRMYLGGPGGTGKSRVIHAIANFFERKGQSRRLRMACYTGVAASHIQGGTLHSTLMLTQRSFGASAKRNANADMMRMWDGVDYLLIDEISMVGCALLADVHQAL